MEWEEGTAEDNALLKGISIDGRHWSGRTGVGHFQQRGRGEADPTATAVDSNAAAKALNRRLHHGRLGSVLNELEWKFIYFLLD